jgi:hypothetical protein
MGERLGEGDVAEIDHFVTEFAQRPGDPGCAQHRRPHGAAADPGAGLDRRAQDRDRLSVRMFRHGGGVGFVRFGHARPLAAQASPP